MARAYHLMEKVGKSGWIAKLIQLFFFKGGVWSVHSVFHILSAYLCKFVYAAAAAVSGLNSDQQGAIKIGCKCK